MPAHSGRGASRTRPIHPATGIQPRKRAANAALFGVLRETSGLLDLLEHLEQAFRGADEHALERLGQATTLERIAAGAAAFGHLKTPVSRGFAGKAAKSR